MNTLLLIIIIVAFGGFFFIILPLAAIIIYVMSFNRRVIALKEIGEDPNEVLMKTFKMKVTKNLLLGSIIKFFPFSGLPISKRFSSEYWTRINYKGKEVEGLVLYVQGDNYRPVKVKKTLEGYELLVKDEDNRDFQMDRVHAQNSFAEDQKLMLWSFLGFTFFALVFGLSTLLIVLYTTHMTITDYMGGAGVIIGG